MASNRIENVTQTIARILEGYDIRLRPNFGGKLMYCKISDIYKKPVVNSQLKLFDFSKSYFCKKLC